MDARITNLYYSSFVNMDHRTDRLAHITEQSKRISLPMTRTRGMKPHEVLEKGLATLDQVGVMMRRTQGAVGCHFSQVEVMKDALALERHAVVFEDDCVFCEDFDKRFEYIHNWANQTTITDGYDEKLKMETQTFEKRQWDVIWLGASFHVNPPYWHRRNGSQDSRSDASANLGYDAKLTDDPRMVQTFGAFATFAYIVNKNSIQKILDLFDQHIHKSIGIDWLFILLQPQLRCYSFVPGCVKQMDNMSDIGNGITKWSGFLQLNGTRENSAYVYQERMEYFDPLTFNWAEAR